MVTAQIYGIKNCDTMKKALKWLNANNIDYQFHDYKKGGVDEGALSLALDQEGWGNVINKRGTTWRQLPKEIQESMNNEKAISVALDNPSIIKRPLLILNQTSYLGFSEKNYQEIFIYFAKDG